MTVKAYGNRLYGDGYTPPGYQQTPAKAGETPTPIHDELPILWCSLAQCRLHEEIARQEEQRGAAAPAKGKG